GSGRGTAPGCHYLATAVSFVRNGSSLPLLVLDPGSEVGEALAEAGISATTAVISPRSAFANLPLLSSSGAPLYSAIIVASDVSCGGCDSNIFFSSSLGSSFGPTPDSDAIDGRAADIAAFFQAGGGILALAGGQHSDVFYKFLPLAVTPAPVARCCDGYTLTSVGTALGLAEGTDDNCCATHNTFQLPASGSPWQVAETDAAGNAETLIVQPAPVPAATPAPPPPTATPAPAPAPAPPPSSAPPAPSQSVVTLVGQQAATTLSDAGITVAIPPVATEAASAVVADVPVPLAPLQTGALVLAVSQNLTQAVLTKVLTAPAPVPVSAAVSTSQGGVVVAGNVAVSLSPAALTGLFAPTAPGQAAVPANVVVNVTTKPQRVVIPGGPAQFSPNGTILDISISNATTGQPITTFPAPVPVTFKYNAADVGQANGNPNLLTAAYVIDANSPELENPLHFPVGTFVIFPPSATTLDTASGTITVQTQAIGSILSVVTNPVGYVQTTTPDAPLTSSFDPPTSQTFSTKSQFSYLQVVEPQIGSRLLVLDPDTNNYAYVNSTDVGPSGAPPTTGASTAVVRGLLEGP
ncbi:MAG: hypothetical protein KGJ86_08150, partial [Chloroflexota bacterium]|nr:hypothetical protein [Chloroflexota bacterium]